MELENNINPDHHIEQYWLGFKNSMENFYSINMSVFSRNIIKWSDNLNKLQKEKKYELIEQYIRDYMICYGLDVIRSGNSYHLRILGSNIKRWNNISSKYIIKNINDKTNIARLLFQCCLDICICVDKSNVPFGDYMNDIELIVIQQNLNPLLDMAEKWNKVFIYDCLINNVKELFINQITNRYGIEIFNNIDINTIKGKTIAKVIFNKNNH